jgi:pimeloyl-ACP methyl ester carboxylesterase
MILLVMGFSFYRQPRAKFFKSFPFRPLTLLSLKPSASPNFSYFYRPHKSTTHRPIVFIHGLGIGLISYIPLFFMLPKDVGILALEVLPITSRITESGILPADQAREIGDIIAQQGLDSFVFVGHSYGTFLAKLLLESSFLASRMERIVLIDPIAVLLHVPELAYNATTRTPKYPGEIEIEWAATAEPDIAFTLAKRFCWRSHILWYEDLLRCPTTVVVGSEDCLMNADAIATYVTKGAPQPDPTSVVGGPEVMGSQRVEWGRTGTLLAGRL